MLQMPPTGPYTPPPMPPAPNPKPNRATAVIIIVAVVLVICVIGGSWLLFGRGQSNATPTATTTVTATATETTTATATATPGIPSNPLLATDPPVQTVMTDLTLPQLPQLSTNAITVNNGGEPQSMPNIQRLADDVAAGNVDKIVTDCWTQPAAEVRAVYGSAPMRGAILQALTTTPQLAQGGGDWQGEYVTLSVLTEELSSNYPCPTITWAGSQPGLGDFTPTMAQWRITRILGVHDGRPVHASDGVSYGLVCDSECGPIWAPHTPTYTYSDTAVPPIVNATTAQWDRLRQLSQSHIAVEQLSNGYFRVRADDGSTDAVAYFTGGYTDFWTPYLLGEID